MSSNPCGWVYVSLSMTSGGPLFQDSGTHLRAPVKLLHSISTIEYTAARFSAHHSLNEILPSPAPGCAPRPAPAYVPSKTWRAPDTRQPPRCPLVFLFAAAARASQNPPPIPEGRPAWRSSPAQSRSRALLGLAPSPALSST